jgi:hypothetical protein
MATSKTKVGPVVPSGARGKKAPSTHFGAKQPAKTTKGVPGAMPPQMMGKGKMPKC